MDCYARATIRVISFLKWIRLTLDQEPCTKPPLRNRTDQDPLELCGISA